jgi:hypothetical protein
MPPDETLHISREVHSSITRTLGDTVVQVRQLGRQLAIDFPGLARIRRELTEQGASAEAIQAYDRVVEFARRLQADAVRVKVAAQDAYYQLAACDPELTPVAPTDDVDYEASMEPAPVPSVEIVKLRKPRR